MRAVAARIGPDPAEVDPIVNGPLYRPATGTPTARPTGPSAREAGPGARWGTRPGIRWRRA